MKTLQQLCPTLNNAELRLIWREVEAAFPKHKTFPTDTPEEWRYRQGHNTALDQTIEKLKEFIGGSDES